MGILGTPVFLGEFFFKPGGLDTPILQYDTGSSSGNSRGDLTDQERRDIKQRVEEGVAKAMYFV